jgi:hypothetical protein
MSRGTWQGGGTWQTSGGGGGLVLAIIVAVVLIGSGPAIASALVTVAIIVASVLVLAIIGVIAWLVHRERSGPARSDRPGRPITARPVCQVPPEVRPQLEEPHKPAIEPPREIHLHLNVSPDQLAAILRHYTEEP